MLLDRGNADDRERARAMLAEAIDGYEVLGMPLLAAKAQEMLTW